ncbi:hypothetical protein AVEN_178635-1 [Araneus ventricosus]|uniref:Uncharacterized protein n=2 Tax=Araneus ventricosus TaxID=182803 RepID=A0A4Y2RQ00_ARAVE|nr:hypothetical protein AVEN_248563-1 [Araneus ventricosus]GBN77902.1 hypothetical protein AVEN_134042-1 [Araneus ventricosus]GBN77907.1 hypothetical protein AVEN_143058-1 [Araneus ventricosus]GBN77920.1 hypothetical protein AVEN_178635-1 [Araneus ventricosus]
MEDREAEEFVLVLERYYSQLVGIELPVDWKDRDPEPIERGMPSTSLRVFSHLNLVYKMKYSSLSKDFPIRYSMSLPQFGKLSCVKDSGCPSESPS